MLEQAAARPVIVPTPWDWTHWSRVHPSGLVPVACRHLGILRSQPPPWQADSE